MTKIILPKAGGPSIFQIDESAPNALADQLAANEVRIQVKYSGINFADIHMRQGLYQDAPPFPFTPGYEVSGIVAEIGSEVKDVSVGDPVCSGTFFNGYSSEVTVPAWQTVKLKSDADEELQRAASLPVSFMTAYLCLFECLKVKSGESLFIDCISGSLGRMMLQMLKGQHLKIYGLTSSQNKVAEIEAQGVHVICGDYRNIPKDLKFDAVVNSKGGESIQLIQKHLNPLGRQVSIGASDMIKSNTANMLTVIKTWWRMRHLSTIDMINQNIGFHGLNVLNLFKEGELVKKYIEMIDSFELESIVDKVFPYQQVGEAQQYIEQRKSRGKVLLKW